MIIITGATGKLGRDITEQLLEKLPAEGIGVSVRDPQKARDLKERGVRVRQGDFADAASLRLAFEGASQVLIISSNSSGADAVSHHRNAIEAAKAEGVGRILYTSHMGAKSNSHFAPMRDHAATEELLKSSGVPFTSLRHGFYADSALLLLGPFQKTGQVVAPADGPVSWTAHADLAAIDVYALTHEGELDGITPPLTTMQSLDLSDLTIIASELLGRSIERVVARDDDYKAKMIERGVPEERAALLPGLFAASRNGEFAATNPALGQLLGRALLSMRDVLKDFVSQGMD